MAKILSFLKSNWQLILLSVVLALLLWVYVVSAEAPQMERVLSVPLRFKNIPDGTTITGTSQTISIRLNAPVRTEILPENIEAYVDLEGTLPGQELLPVNVAPIPGATILEIRPDRVLVNLEKIETKEMTVEVLFLGQLPQGFTLGPIEEISPPAVTVSGAQSLLERAQRVVATVDLTGVTSEISQTAILRVLDAQGLEVTQLSIEPPTANILVAVNLQSLVKTVPVVPQLEGSPASGYLVSKVICDPQVATLEGTADVLASISSITTYPISIEGATESFTEKVSLNISSLEARLLTSRIVEVTVEIEEAGSTSLEIPVEIVDGDLPVSLDQETLTVEVSAPKSLIDSLRARDFRVWVDCSNLKEGTYTLPVEIETPLGVLLLNVKPSKISVVIGE